MSSILVIVCPQHRILYTDLPAFNIGRRNQCTIIVDQVFLPFIFDNEHIHLPVPGASIYDCAGYRKTFLSISDGIGIFIHIYIIDDFNALVCKMDNGKMLILFHFNPVHIGNLDSYRCLRFNLLSVLIVNFDIEESGERNVLCVFHSKFGGGRVQIIIVFSCPRLYFRHSKGGPFRNLGFGVIRYGNLIGFS